MRRIWLLLASVMLLLIAGTVVYWFEIPKLESVSPQPGSREVAADSVLRLEFSRPMQPESVEERLIISPQPPGSFAWDGKTMVFKPEQPWSAGSKIEISLGSGARAAGLLSSSIQESSNWSFEIREPHLVYLYPANKAPNIYIYDPGTGENQPLTNLLGGVFEFDINTPGTVIYYSAQNELGGSNIYGMTINKTRKIPDVFPVLECQKVQCRAPRVSPGEDFLAYERTAPTGSDQPNYPQVWYMALPESNQASSTASNPGSGESIRAGEANHQTLQPDWSSSGLLSFYDTNQAAFIIMDPKGTLRTTIPNQTGVPGSWRPNEQSYVAPEIIFTTTINPAAGEDLQQFASSHLLLTNVEDGTTKDLTGAEYLEDTSPAFSPDGRLLAFSRKFLDITRWTPGRQLWVMNSDGSLAQQLTNQPNFNHFNFAWDPTGKQLVFVRFDQTMLTKLPEIWVIDLETKFETQIISGGYAPRWIP